MQGLFRRIVFFFLALICLLAASSSLKAYPVAITINVTFSEISGDKDPLGLGLASPPTAVITTTVESSAPAASYPVSVSLTVPALGITNRIESGSLTINTNGQIGANFSDAQGSFTAVLALQGVTFPSPVPTSFGTASFSAPSSTVSYDLLGAVGTVGVTGTATATGLSASPVSPISVSYQTGGTAPASHTISVNASSPTGFTASILPGMSNSSTGFLTLSTSAGTTPGSVTANFSTAVSAGTYTAEIAINTSSDSTGAPITIPVTYTVTSPSQSGPIAANPTSLAFSFVTGGVTPTPKTVALTSTLSPAPAFTAASSVPWATVTPTSGTTPSTLTVTVNPATLAVGTYSGNINVVSSSTTLSIPITFTISPLGGGGPAFTISPTNLSFQFFVPGSTTQSQTVQVTTSANTATYTASVGSGSFLSVTPTSGLIPGSVTVTANVASLAQGTYSGTILFTAPSAPTITLPVTVTYGSGSTPTGLNLSTKSYTFNYVTGAAAPPPLVVQVTDTTPVAFTVTSSTFYLPVSPVFGTTPGSFTVSLNTAGLAVGVYHETVSVAPSLGFLATLPITINVTGPVVVTPPTVTPTSLTFLSSGATPAAQTVTISGTAATKFSTTAPYLTVTSAVSGANTVLTVTANPAGLTAGTYTTAISLTAPVVLTIPVTFTVSAPATPTLSASPSSVAFAYQTGGTAPASQTVVLSANPTGPYTVTGYGAWLTVALSADSTTATISVDTTGLTPGVYVSTLKITGAGFTNSPLFVPVTLTVSSNPAIGVSPTTLTFNYQPNGAAPPSQTVAVASSSASPVTTATADSPFIVVAMSAELPANGGASLTVSVVPGSMANGTYHGNITVTTADATLTIPVTLNIDAVAIPVLTAVTNGISFDNNIGAPGLIVSLWGTGLGPATPSSLELANATSVATTNAGTQVFANGIPCPILFSSAQQVNAILPFSLQGAATAQVQLTYNGVMSSTVTIPIQPSAPSLFSTSATGQGGGAILNQDLSINSASNPASAGTIVAIYGGGGGPTNPPGVDGLLVPIVTPFPAPLLAGSVTVGGQPAQLVYYGDAPGLVSGVLQFNVVIPAGTASGPQPVVVTIGTSSSQPNILVYVQ